MMAPDPRAVAVVAHRHPVMTHHAVVSHSVVAHRSVVRHVVVLHAVVAMHCLILLHRATGRACRVTVTIAHLCAGNARATDADSKSCSHYYCFHHSLLQTHEGSRRGIRLIGWTNKRFDRRCAGQRYS